MLWHIDRLPLRYERQKKICFFCRHVFCFGILFRLLIVKIQLGIFRPRAQLIGIALLEHLGDIVASEPLIRKLRKKHPDAFIVWFLGSAYRELAESNPNCDMTVPLSDLSEWIVIRNSRLLDQSIDLHLPGRICTNCNVVLKKTSGNPRINSRNYYEFGNLLAVMAQNAGLPIIGDGPILSIPLSASCKIDKLALPARFICIHCNSNEADRDWEAEKWHDLVYILAETHQIPVVEIGLKSALPNVNLPLFSSHCGSLSILETADLIRRATIFVGIDSGPAHLANAVGTFGIILLGKYREFANHMPYSGAYQDGSNAKIIRHNGPASDISVAEVANAVLRII